MKKDKNERIINELENPLPDTIPNIVWDDLLYSDKENILNAVKSKYTVTYYHTERRYKKGFTTNTTVNDMEDTDVIKIEETNGFTTVSYIYSRATSERGVINIENPVPDIIPSDKWNNLPDVLKEEIIKAKNQKNNFSVVIEDPRFNISYNPDKDIINIRSGSGTVRYTDTYDAKRGVLIDSLAHRGL